MHPKQRIRKETIRSCKETVSSLYSVELSTVLPGCYIYPAASGMGSTFAFLIFHIILHLVMLVHVFTEISNTSPETMRPNPNTRLDTIGRTKADGLIKLISLIGHTHALITV